MNIEQFKSVYSHKMGYAKAKRIKAIHSYFANEWNLTMKTNEPNECLNEILNYTLDNPESEAQVLADIVDILNDRYSHGNPFYLFDVVFEQNVTVDSLSHLLSSSFSGTISSEMFDFHPHRAHRIDRLNSTVTIECRYEEFRPDLTGENLRISEIANSGQIPVTISIQRKKMLINSGYNKAASNLAEVLNRACRSKFSTKPLDIQREAQHMPNLISVNNAFHALTLLTLKLILADFNNPPYTVHDIISISFNNEEAIRVKNARLAGTRLIDDPDVIERVYIGDKITHFVINLIRFTSTGAVDFSSDVLIDFRNGLKIQFANSEYENWMVADIAFHLEEMIRMSIIDKNSAINAEKYITQRMTLIPIRDRELLTNFLHGIRQQLISLLPRDSEQIIAYFSDTLGL